MWMKIGAEHIALVFQYILQVASHLENLCREN